MVKFTARPDEPGVWDVESDKYIPDGASPHFGVVAYNSMWGRYGFFPDPNIDEDGFTLFLSECELAAVSDLLSKLNRKEVGSVRS